MLAALYQSFYQPIIYWRAAHEWRSVKYILLLVLISALSSTYIFTAHIPYASLYRAAANFPVMTLQGGTLQIDRPQPYIVYLEQGEQGEKPEAFVIFDNTGAYTVDTLKEAQILVTATGAHIKKNTREVENYSFLDTTDKTITPHDVGEWVTMAKAWAWPVILFLLLVGYFIGYGLLMLLYALAGIAIARYSAIYLDYLQLMRVALVAMTPMTVVQSTLAVAGIEGVSFWLDMLVTLGYLTYGIRAARSI